MTRSDVASAWIDSKQDGAFKSVVFGHNFSEKRKRFFTAVFIISTDKDNVLSLAQAILAFKSNPLIIGLYG